MTDQFSPWPVSLAEAARETGLTTKALRAMIRSGDLPYVILPGQTRRKMLLRDIADVVGRCRVYCEVRAKGRRVRVSSPTESTRVYDFTVARADRVAASRAKEDAPGPARRRPRDPTMQPR